jgi:hypothetical protein
VRLAINEETQPENAAAGETDLRHGRGRSSRISERR